VGCRFRARFLPFFLIYVKDYFCFIFENKTVELALQVATTCRLQKTANAALVATARVLAEV
jgi:hypothetical protein